MSPFEMALRMLTMAWMAAIIFPSGAIDPGTTLECHRRQYNYKVQQSDSEGRTCWDHINVMSCWGRCDSNEIADWKFPYKRSFHPVCLHATMQENTVELRNCHPEASPEVRVYKFQEAASCGCTICKSSEASCEGLRYRGARRAPHQSKRDGVPPKDGQSTPSDPLKMEDTSFALVEALQSQGTLRKMLDRLQEISKEKVEEAVQKRGQGQVSSGQIPFLEPSTYSDNDFLSFFDSARSEDPGQGGKSSLDAGELDQFQMAAWNEVE